jgi:Predicted signal-transduction protein containing cAMP-binding and CBS domains
MKKAEEIMTRNPVCCVPENSVIDAAQLMKSEDVGPIPVIENAQNKRLVGILTDRDIVIKVIAENRDPKNTKIQDAMTPNPVSCFPDDDLDDVLGAMEQNQIRRIPVVDHDNYLVGIIAQADVAIRLDKTKKTGEVVEEISKR